MKEQLKEMSQNTKKQGFVIIDHALKKNAVLFCKSVLMFSYVGGTTPIAFLSAEADEEGHTAIRNKN